MPTTRTRRAAGAAPSTEMASLARLAAASREAIEQDRAAATTAFNEQTLHFQTAIDKISQGVCSFSPSAEIVICNQAYLRMYALSPDIVKPGCSLRRLIEHRRRPLL